MDHMSKQQRQGRLVVMIARRFSGVNGDPANGNG